MISKAQHDRARAQALEMYARAGIALTETEKDGIEIADFGLDDFERTGLILVTYVNTERCCAKEMVLLPGQTCPEHRHPAFDGYVGKEETFRVRYGTVYLYVEGEIAKPLTAKPPKGDYTVFREIILAPGEQYTLCPNALHWFQGGPQGAVVSEFSTPSHDDRDVFTDIRIRRAPEVEAK